MEDLEKRKISLMNRKIGIIGSIINAITVALFAIFLLMDFKLGYLYFLPIGILSFLHFEKNASK